MAALTVAIALSLALTGCSEFTAITKPESTALVGTWIAEDDPQSSFEVEPDGEAQFADMPENVRLSGGEQVDGRAGKWETDEGISGQPGSLDVYFEPEGILSLQLFTEGGQAKLLYIIGDFDSRDYVAFVRQ